MKYMPFAFAVLLLLSGLILAQQPPPPPAPPAPSSPPAPPQAPDLGKWWKNSEVVRDLQLNDNQVKQIEQIFLEHRVKLSDLRAELERQETQMRALLSASQLDEKKVEEQTSAILAARGNLERANTGMMLAFRRALSAEQWKKLEEIRRARKTPPPLPPAPPLPPTPPPSRPAAPETMEVGKTASGEPIYKIAGAVNPPVVLHQPVPRYTPEAREKRIEGLILLEAIIDKEGKASEVKILRGLGYGLDESAVNSVTKEWRFKPGTIDGKPVNVKANIEMSFRLY